MGNAFPGMDKMVSVKAPLPPTKLARSLTAASEKLARYAFCHSEAWVRKSSKLRCSPSVIGYGPEASSEDLFSGSVRKAKASFFWRKYRMK